MLVIQLFTIRFIVLVHEYSFLVGELSLWCLSANSLIFIFFFFLYYFYYIESKLKIIDINKSALMFIFSYFIGYLIVKEGE